MPRLDPFADLIAPQSQPSDPFADLIAPSAPAAPSRPSTVPTQSRYEALSRLEMPQARTGDLVLTGRGSMPDDRTVEEQRVIESAPVYNQPSLPRPAAPLPKHDPMVDPETVAEYERAKAMHAKQGYPLNNDPDAGLLDDLRTWLVGGTMQGVKGAVGVADTFRAVTDALPAPLAALGGIVPQPGMPQPGEVVRDTVSFNDIEQGLNAGQSAGTQAEQKRFSEAKGIIEKAGVALTSPRLIAKSIVESIPLMVGGAWAGKALVGSTPLAAAIGEGAGMMGVDAETMAESNDDGRLQPKQAMLAAAIGTLGAAIGRYSSALAGKLGVADADMLLVGAVQNPKIKRALARNIAVGMVQEGVFEELPQGLVETALTNIATGKPMTEGMADDAILGTITGAAMGGGAQVLSAPAQAEAARQAKAEEDRRAENTQRFNAANERYFARFTPEGRATALEQWRAEQQAKAAPPATQDDVTATFARMMARPKSDAAPVSTEEQATITVESAPAPMASFDDLIAPVEDVSTASTPPAEVAQRFVQAPKVSVEFDNAGSIVVRFIKQPSYGTLEALKSRGFRWSKDDKAWYHRNPEKLTSERGDGALRFALEKTKALVGLPIDEDLRKPEFDYNEERKRKASIPSIPPADVSMESENIDTPTATRVSDDEARAALTDEDRVADAPAGAGRDWPLILGHARAQGYTGSAEALLRAKQDIEGFEAANREETDSTDTGVELLKAIRDAGGIKDDGGGEFSTLWEASTGFVPQGKTKAGDRYKKSRNYATGGVLGVGNVLVKYGSGGKSWDYIREALSQDPAFRRFADMSVADLQNEVMELVATRTAQGEGREARPRGLDYTRPGWWQDRINNAGYTPAEQEASDFLGTFTPEKRRELYEELRNDEDWADAMGVEAEIFKRLEQEYAGGNVAGTDQADVAGSRANDRTAEQGPRRAGQAATQGDRPTAQARPVSVDTLAEDFGLTPPAAQATMALVEAMGLDPQRILTTKGGEPGSGSLEQRQRSGGTVRASVEFMQSGEALIRALENPNASSAIHEIAHIARRWLMNRDVPAEQRRGITDQDIAIAETWAGVSDGKWTTKAEEKFARGFERYLRDGVSPTPRLSKIFKAFSQWLTEIYRTVTGSEIDVDISLAMREVFDRLVTRSERLAKGEMQAEAKAETKPSGPPRSNPAPVPEDIRTLGMDDDTAPEFGAALDVPADVRSSLETAEKAALDRLKKKRESGGVLYQADRKRKPKRSAVGTMRPFVEALGHGDLDGLISDGMYETFQSSFQLSDDGLDLREESTLNNGRDRAAGRTKAAPLSMFTNWLESPQADEAVAALDKKLYPGETPYAERLATARDVLKKVGAQASDVLYQSDAAEALPFDDRNDLLVIGAAKMARGITDFAKWSQAMTADLGDSIAPGLRDLYTASRNRAVLLSKFDPNDYFNFKRSALTGDTLEALKASVIDTVLATGRIPKEKETWDEIRVDAEYYGPEIVKYLAPFQKQQAQFRVVRYAAKQRIDALKADIYRDWQKIDRQRREGVLDPVAYAVEERKIDAKERDVRELLNVWMRMRSEDGRNLAMHRIIAERTWDDYEFWTRRAKKAMGLPPTVDLPAEVEKRINEIIQGGKIKIAERKARAPREAKPSGPPTSKPRTRVYVPKTPAQSKMLAAVEKMKAAMAAKAQAELGNVLYQADTVKTVDADLVQYAREFIEAAREDGTTDPEAAWSEFADIFGESYDGLRDAFEEAARDVFDAPDVVIPKVARGKRRGRLDDMRALGREDDGSPEFADPNAGKPSRREVRERQDIAAGAFGDTTPLEGMVEDDGTVEYADPNTPAPKAVKPSKADVQMREDAASGAFGQDIEDEVKRNLAKMLMELDQSTLGETALSVWKASLLLGLRTHELNMTSNALNQMALELRRIPGALADVAMSLVTGRRTMQGASFKSVLKASRKGAKEGAKRSVEVMRGGDALDTFIKTGTRRELNSGYPWLDTYANTVFRTLSAEDAFMRSIAFRRAMEEQAWLKAKALGITPAEVLLRPAESMIAQAITDAEIAAMEERAQEDAAEATFNQKNKIAGEWNRIVRNLKADPDYNPLGYFLDFTVPFTNTPANVTEAILKHIVPYGATKAALSAVRDRGLSAEQQRAIADGIGKAGIGWSLMYMGYALAAAGLMTGGGGSGDDRGDRNVQTAAGRIPGAILVNERWHTISGLAPVGTLMTVGATMYRATHRQDRAKSLSPKNIGAAVGQVMLDQPMVVGLHDLVQLLAGQVDERYTAKSVLASFIPNIISDAAALFDPYRREPRKDGFSAPMWDGIRMRLPGLRNYLPESSDVLGSAREQNRAMLVDLFRSTRAKELSDPVLKALLDADVGVTYPKRADGETEDAYRERSKKTGQMIEKMVKATVSSPSFARLPVETRTKLLKAAIDRAKDAVPAPRPPR